MQILLWGSHVVYSQPLAPDCLLFIWDFLIIDLSFGFWALRVQCLHLFDHSWYLAQCMAWRALCRGRKQDAASGSEAGPGRQDTVGAASYCSCSVAACAWSFPDLISLPPVSILFTVLSSDLFCLPIMGTLSQTDDNEGHSLIFPLADSARQCHLENHACLVLLSLFSRWWGLLAQVPTNLGQTRSSCSLSGPWNVKYLNMSKKRSEGWRFRKMTPGLGWPELEQHVGLAFTLEEMGISGGRGSGNAKSGVLGLSSNQISFCDGGSPSGGFFFLCLFVLRQYLSM